MNQFLKAHIQEITHLNDDEFEAVLPFFTRKKFRKRQFLIQENQPVHEVYLIEKGILKSSTVGRTGKEHILQFAAPN